MGYLACSGYRKYAVRTMNEMAISGLKDRLAEHQREVLFYRYLYCVTAKRLNLMLRDQSI